MPSHPQISQLQAIHTNTTIRFHFWDKRTYLFSFHLKITDTKHKYLKLSSMEQSVSVGVCVCVRAWVCFACSKNKAIFAGAVSVAVFVTITTTPLLSPSYSFHSRIHLIHFDSPLICISVRASKSGTKYIAPTIYRYVTKSTNTGHTEFQNNIFLNRFVSPSGRNETWNGPHRA